MLSNNNNKVGDPNFPSQNEMMNRSNNFFIANNPLNDNTNQAAPGAYNPYEQINDKSNISGFNKQNSNFQNLELGKTNSNRVPINDFPNNNVNAPQAADYSQISNLDSSRFTNIPLNDLNNSSNISALGNNNYNEKPNFAKTNLNNNLTHTPTLMTNNATGINNNYNKLATNNTGIPASALKGAGQDGEAEGAKVPVSPEDKAKDHLVEKKNKTVSYCYYIFHLVLLIVLIPTISLIYLAKKKVNLSELSYFAEIFSNWRSGPIDEVSLNCDKKETLINDWWPGTASGCLCNDAVAWGRCRRKSYCKNIDIVPPIKYKFWKGNSICVQRQEGGYLDMILARSASECPQNMVSCGLADTQGNFLCVEKNRNCPINKIFKMDENYRPKSSDMLLPLSDTKLVLSREAPTSAIPVQFKVAFGQPCLNPYFENLNFDVYRLNYFFGKQKCYMYADFSEQSTAVFDVNYALIDSYQGESLYTENGIKSAIAALPLYDAKEFQRTVSLYAKNYFGLKIACFQNLQKSEKLLSEILDDSMSISNLDDLTASFIVSLVIQFIILVLVIIVICCFRGTINPKKKQRPVRINSGHLCCYCILYVFMALCYFIFIGVNSNSGSNLKLTETFHKTFGSKDCVDDFTLDLYDRFIPSIDSARKYLGNASLFMGLIMISQLVFFIFAFCKISKTDFYDDEE